MEADQLKNQISGLEEKLKQAGNERADLTQTVRTQKSKIQKIETEKSSFEGMLKEAMQSICLKDDQLAQSENEAHQLKLCIAELDDQAKMLLTKINEHLMAITQLEEKVGDLNGEI